MIFYKQRATIIRTVHVLLLGLYDVMWNRLANVNINAKFQILKTRVDFSNFNSGKQFDVLPLFV